MTKRFWLIGSVDERGKLTDLQQQQHHDHGEARVHAETMARKHAGERFVILEAIDTVRKSDIAWEPCYDELPF